MEEEKDIQHVDFLADFMNELKRMIPEPTFPRTKETMTWRLVAYMRYQTFTVSKKGTTKFTCKYIGLLLKRDA